jgi:hypothetical protein
MTSNRPATTEPAAAIRKALTLYGFGVLGVFLTVTPWTSLWYQAARGLAPEPLLNAVLSGWARGAVTAVGLLDLTVALRIAGEMPAILRTYGRDGTD